MPHMRARKKHQVTEDDDFDDEAGLDALEDTIPQLRSTVERAKPFITPVINEVLPPGIIDIHQEVGCLLPREQSYPRIHHHFLESDLGYRRLTNDTGKFRIRTRTYPWFGAFTGKITIRENIEPVPGAHASYRRIDIDGYLRYRPSALLIGFVALALLLLILWTQPGLVPSIVLLTLGITITTILTYRLGRDENEEVEDRLAESFMRLRSTIHNRR